MHCLIVRTRCLLSTTTVWWKLFTCVPPMPDLGVVRMVAGNERDEVAIGQVEVRVLDRRGAKLLHGAAGQVWLPESLLQ